jgi:hypothetical protein
MEFGILYCFSNPYMKDLETKIPFYKIGMTTKDTMKLRLRDANSETYGMPCWKCEMQKQIPITEEKPILYYEKKVHGLLESYNERVTPRREFFCTSLSTIKTIFDLLPGEYITETPPNEVEVEQVVPEVVIQNKERDLRLYLNDGAQIEHTVIIDKATNEKHKWIGIYNLEQNMIIYEYSIYPSPTAFAVDHVASITGNKTNRSGWSECKAMINGELKYLKDLPVKSI